ncbi:MAG: Clp protease ClpP [Clostridium sp.]
MIKLYGDIEWWSENSAREFIARLQEESDRVQDAVEVHVHCYGGNVLEGNLIFNAIKNNSKPVHMYVDGLAASQAAIILLAAEKVFISDNAFIMIHAPHSSRWGTADDLEKEANSLRGMEKSFAKALMAKTGKSEEDVQKWFVGDNWFSSDQAIAIGLADAIVDKIVIPDMVEDDMTPDMVHIDQFYAKYTALLTTDSPSNQTNKKEKEMDKKEIISKFGLTGVSVESSDQEVMTALENVMSQERSAKDAAEARLAAQDRAQRDAVIATVSSRINADQKAQLESIGEKAGIEALKVAVSGFSQKATFTHMINTGGGNSVSGAEAAWGFDEWQKNNPSGLEQMAREDYERFNALYQAKFKADAPK